MLSDLSGVNSTPIYVNPEDEDGVIPWHIGEFSHLDAAVCPIIFH
jgi:hypothetical protein